MFDTENATDNDLAAATFVILTFTTQKNGVRGDKIGHGATGDLLLCPKEALRQRVMHLRQHDAQPTHLSPNSNHLEATG